jgi:uncharacterized protein YkwD
MIAARRHLFLSALAALLLSACGGGAGNADLGGNNGTVAASAPVAVGASVDTRTNSHVDAGAPISVGIVATDGRNWLNYRRAQIGLSQLSENTLVDRAAQSHSDYQRINNTISHAEQPNAWAYTGGDLQTRLASAQFPLNMDNYVAGEVITSTTNTSGFYMAEELITAIYHRFVIFEPVFKEIGTGSGTSERNYTYFTADFVANNGVGPGLGRGKLVNWPVNGQADVPPNFYSDQQEPEPVDTLNEVGYPVSVHADWRTVVTVSKFTIKPRNGGELSVKLLQNATDSKTPASAAAIIPLTRLASATTYDVAFTGTASGVPVSLSWSFTTK